MPFVPSVRRCASVVLLCLAMAACSGTALRAPLPAAQQATVTDRPLSYLHQGGGDGRMPPIVFQSGLGDDHSTWMPVLRQLPAQIEAIAPDRPGYGASPARDEVRDACRIAEEQRALLQGAGLRPPYLLVGHSLGGLYQYVYARLYPDEVAGLVLLDPTHPRLHAQLQHQQPVAAALLQLARHTVFTPAMAQEFDAQASCLDRVEQQAPLAAPVQLLASTEAPAYMSAGLQGLLEGLRQDWVQRSGAALTRVAGSGHRIQQDAPEAVVRAIEALARPAAAL